MPRRGALWLRVPVDVNRAGKGIAHCTRPDKRRLVHAEGVEQALLHKVVQPRAQPLFYYGLQIIIPHAGIAEAVLGLKIKLHRQLAPVGQTACVAHNILCRYACKARIRAGRPCLLIFAQRPVKVYYAFIRQFKHQPAEKRLCERCGLKISFVRYGYAALRVRNAKALAHHKLAVFYERHRKPGHMLALHILLCDGCRACNFSQIDIHNFTSRKLFPRPLSS